MATKLCGVGDAWKVPPSKHNSSLALDSSAFRPPADVGLQPNTTIISSLHHTTTTTDSEARASSSDRSSIKKSQKRPRSPPGLDVTPEAPSKYLTTSTSQRLVGSAASVTAVDSLSHDEPGRQFSPVDNRRRMEEFSSNACSLMPLCHEYQSSADGATSLQLLARQDVTGVHAIPATSALSSTTNQTSQSSVAASPYLPFFNSTPSSNISGLYYPSPYVMLSAQPLTYPQTAPHFPCGPWISSVVSGAEQSPSKLVAERMQQQLDSQTQQPLHRPPPISAAFDFPWMRGSTMQTAQFLPKASPQLCDLYEGQLAAATKQSFNQYMLMRNVGAALASDGLDMYRQPSCDLPSSMASNRVLLDNHPSSYFGIYPPLFHTPYLGIPSR